MQIKLIEKKEQPLLKRKIMKFKVEFDSKKSTPKREELRKLIADEFKLNPETFIIKKAGQVFGKTELNLIVNVYESKELLEKTESYYLFVRDKLKPKKEKKKKKKFRTKTKSGKVKKK